MNVLTQSPLPSARMLMSTGNGIFAGSPMVATSLALHLPSLPGRTSQSLEVSAAAVTAQSSFFASDQRISRGPPGTARAVWA
jgi:hypothetical protein